jgi:ADP-ribose pyrophosphatase YjhB (NUDIX family)
MLKRFFPFIWLRAPRWARRAGVWLTESHFTVTTGAVIVDERDRVLLLQHYFRPGGGWGIPGGFMRQCEQPDETIRRELAEEVGLQIENIEIAFVRALERYNQLEIIFRCRSTGDPRPAGFEVYHAEWFELGALPEGLCDDQRRLIDHALQKRGPRS